MIRVANGPIPSGNSYGFVNSGDFGVSVMQKSEFLCKFYNFMLFYEKVNLCHFMIFASCHENQPPYFATPIMLFGPKVKGPGESQRSRPFW